MTEWQNDDIERWSLDYRGKIGSLDVVDDRWIGAAVTLARIIVVVLLFVGVVYSLGSYSNYRIVKKRPFFLETADDRDFTAQGPGKIFVVSLALPTLKPETFRTASNQSVH